MSARLPAIIAIMAFGYAQPSVAVAAGPLVVATSMMVEKRVAAADGTVRMELAAPTRVVPGDRVTIILSYRNAGARPIADLVLANPVPTGMVFRSAGSGALAPELSVDGHRFADLATLQMSSAAGATRPATLADVTQVRWRLGTPVAPGAGGRLTFEAIVK